MSARNRYQIAFFALGWLIAFGILFQMGVGSGFHSLYDAVNDRLRRLAQRFSDSEGNAVRDVRGSSRTDYLAPLRPTLSTVNGLKKISDHLVLRRVGR